MPLIDRVFMGIIAVILIVFASMLTLTVMGNDLFVDWLQSPSLIFDGGLVAIILLLLAVYLLIMITRYEKAKFIVYQRELGAVKISADCVQGLIIEASREVSGVQEVVAALITDVEEPKVSLKIKVYPDHNIPQLSEKLQESVRSYVESTVGVVITEVEVFVVGITEQDKTDLDALV